MNNVLVTGATGFIGKELINALEQRGWQCRAALRGDKQSHRFSDSVITGELTADQDWTDALDDIDVVVHLAAKVPERNCSLLTYIQQNTAATINLARQAETANVKRFVFISSIKVNGEKTEKDRPFTEAVDKEPTDPYALSKFKAENELIDISRSGNMEVVVIRPPLVYGPGAKGNFAVMLGWLQSGVPLPFGRIHNRRSMIALDNLIDFICLCTQHPDAANQVFLISDDESISTTELLHRTARTFSYRPRFIPVPSPVLQLIAILLGKKQVADSLLYSLELDISKAKNILGWKPCISMPEQLIKMSSKQKNTSS